MCIIVGNIVCCNKCECISLAKMVTLYDMCGYVMFAKYWIQRGRSIIAV